MNISNAQGFCGRDLQIMHAIREKGTSAAQSGLVMGHAMAIGSLSKKMNTKRCKFRE